MLRAGLGRRTFGHRTISAGPSFSLPFTDLGSGAVSTTEIIGGAAPTFTRATAAASKLSTGLWKLDVASGTARFTYTGLDTTVTTTGGYFAEGLRVNSVLQARDLTSASWTKTTMTTAKTSTGIDGVANSCTRCTASAGNGTALQAVVLANAAKAFGVWIKRITGTGEIDITLDNGTTWNNITASINASTFTLVQATQTLTNPTVGIRIVTNGDAIDVDVCQLEDGASFISSPVATTVAAVTRNADVLTYPTTGWLNAAAGTFYAAMTLNPSVPVAQTFMQIDDGTNNERYFLDLNTPTAARFTTVDNGVTQAQITDAVTAGAMAKIAGAYALNDFSFAANGALGTPDTGGTLPTVTTARIGTGVTAGFEAYAPISSVRYFPRRLLDQQLQLLTA